jgi:hypothetical protein
VPPAPRRYAGPEQGATPLEVMSAGSVDTGDARWGCIFFGVDSRHNRTCAPGVVTKGPATVLADPPVLGVPTDPGMVDVGPVYFGVGTCNAYSLFSSSVTRNATTGEGIGGPYLQAAVPEDFVQDNVPEGPSPSPSPSPQASPSPSPQASPSPSPITCALVGTYTIAVKSGRSECHSGETEYLVYYGGSSKNCANPDVFVRKVGSFKAQRSHWTINTDGDSVTTLATEGRQCPTTSSLGAHTKVGDLSVGFDGNAKTWMLEPVDASCTVFNVMNTGRSSRKYLSSHKTCAEAKVFVASGDKFTGRQQWTVTKVAE